MKEGIEIENPYVCWECGGQYLEENGWKRSDSIVTAHMGKCCVCHEEKTVIHERNYKWLARWKSNKSTDK